MKVFDRTQAMAEVEILKGSRCCKCHKIIRGEETVATGVVAIIDTLVYVHYPTCPHRQ